ncbi:MAG TPA: radical SAM family heme chaperone HemW [Longimicrobiales bacterium]|nr:radical SAM family heme chaperone HemW [Longimicrobiales bacterium]
MKIRHLYIHVPFCARRCGYCDFAVTATSSAPVEAWLTAIRAELEERQRRERWQTPMALDTIYVGGGTPSLLGTGAMARLRDLLQAFAEWDSASVEWTAEANPESFSGELAEDWVAAGVNRISLGAQTFHQPALRWMGRLHGTEGPATAVAAARGAGLDNVSIDLIFGLPARLERDWAGDLDRALALEPAHISLYGLTAESGTPLGRWVREGREQLADDGRYADEFVLAADRLTAAGLQHYEVSNFARPGRDSRHNRAYWRHAPYLGLGPGSHSFLPPVRAWNVRDWAEYRSRLEQGTSVEAGCESLTADDLALESAWLGLRTDDGVPVRRLAPAQRELVALWQAQGLAWQAGEVVRLTTAGWLILDRLAVELDARRGTPDPVAAPDGA